MSRNPLLIFAAAFLRALGIGLTGVILGLYLARAGFVAAGDWHCEEGRQVCKPESVTPITGSQLICQSPGGISSTPSRRNEWLAVREEVE